MKVSIVIPCFNERATIEAVLRKVRQVPLDIDREIVAVDDGSTDGTREYLASLQGRDHDLRVVLHPRNRGKGAALRSGFAAATGDIILVQDADLEADPADYPRLLAPLVDGRAQVVYGSRFIPRPEAHPVHAYRRCLVNKLLTHCSNFFTDLNLTDMEVCYKLFRSDLLPRLRLTEDRFGFEPEFTARIARLGCTVYEVAVSYAPRSSAQGKKIGWKDGLRALFVILKCGLARR